MSEENVKAIAKSANTAVNSIMVSNLLAQGLLNMILDKLITMMMELNYICFHQELEIMYPANAMIFQE